MYPSVELLLLVSMLFLLAIPKCLLIFKEIFITLVVKCDQFDEYCNIDIVVTESVQYVAKVCNHVQQVCVGCLPVETCFHNADLTVLKELYSSPPLCGMADKLCLCFDPRFTVRSYTECTVVLLHFHAHHRSSVLVQDMQLNKCM